jgi:hypothetical protein
LLECAESLRREQIQTERAKLDDLTTRLEQAKKDAHELPPQIATLTARVARLEAQTGAEYGRERLGGKDDRLSKIAALFNGWANSGPNDGGPSNGWSAPAVLNEIGAALGDPFAPEVEAMADAAEKRHAEVRKVEMPYFAVRDIPLPWLKAHDGIWEDEAGDRAHMAPDRRIRPRGTTWEALRQEAEQMPARVVEVP